MLNLHTFNQKWIINEFENRKKVFFSFFQEQKMFIKANAKQSSLRRKIALKFRFGYALCCTCYRAARNYYFVFSSYKSTWTKIWFPSSHSFISLPFLFFSTHFFPFYYPCHDMTTLYRMLNDGSDSEGFKSSKFTERNNPSGVVVINENKSFFFFLETSGMNEK